MSDRLKVNLVKYGCCAIFVAVAAGLYIAPRDFVGSALVDQFLILCDAFTIPGILLLMVGFLVWVSNEGALDGVTYAVRFAVFSLIPGRRLERDEKYSEYVERRRGKKVRGYGFLFVSGAVTLAISLVFMALFYALYE